MGPTNENILGFNGATSLQGGVAGGKIKPTTNTGPTRRVLGIIDTNITDVQSRPNAVNKRSLSQRYDVICNNPPVHRPITRKFAAQLAGFRKFAAQLADQKPQTHEQETTKPNSVSSQEPEPERIIIDVDDSDTEETNKLYLVSREEPERITIDVDNSDKEEEEGDFNEPMFVQHTEAMMDEIDQMDIEMDDVDEEEDEPVIDIDACDENNPLYVVHYIQDMHANYKEFEIYTLVPTNYMNNQKDLNEKMRGILIDWLIEVHYKFELMDETLYLTINVIDRFLAVHQIARKKLQLVGVTALLIACKYEEVSVPVVDDLILISDKAYTRNEVIDMEKLMANTLQFNFSLPTPYVFMKRFLQAAQSDKKLEVLSFFMIELCLVEYEMLEYLPSMLAASAIYAAQCTLKGFEEWNKTCEFYTGYTEDQLLECTRKMVALHLKAGTGKLTRVYRKYNTSKFNHAARTEPAGFLL